MMWLSQDWEAAAEAAVTQSASQEEDDKEPTREHQVAHASRCYAHCTVAMISLDKNVWTTSSDAAWQILSQAVGLEDVVNLWQLRYTC